MNQEEFNQKIIARVDFSKKAKGKGYIKEENIEFKKKVSNLCLFINITIFKWIK